MGKLTIAKVNEMQQKLLLNTKNMTEAEQNAYRAKIQNVQMMYEEANAIAKTTEELQKKADAARQAVIDTALAESNKMMDDYTNAEGKADYLRGKYQEAQNEVEIAQKGGNQGEIDAATQKMEKYKQALTEAEIEAAKLEAEVGNLAKKFNITDNVVDSTDDLKRKISEITTEFQKNSVAYQKLNTISSSAKGQSQAWKEQLKDLKDNDKELGIITNKIKQFIEELKKVGANVEGFDKINKELEGLATEAEQLDGTSIAAVENFVDKLEDVTDVTTAGTFQEFATEVETNMESARESINLIGTETTTAMQNFDTATSEATNSADQLAGSLQNANGAANDLPEFGYQASAAFTQFAGAAMSTYAVINSFVNLGKTFKDVLTGDASALQVVGTVLSTVMAIAMAFNGVMALANTLKKSETIWNWAVAVSENSVVKNKIADIAATLGLESAMAPLLVIWSFIQIISII